MLQFDDGPAPERIVEETPAQRRARIKKEKEEEHKKELEKRTGECECYSHSLPRLVAGYDNALYCLREP